MIGIRKIFTIGSAAEFDAIALEVFRYQYQKNPVYQQFCDHLGVTTTSVEQVLDIPFLPIEFFKSKKILSNDRTPQAIFTSSGTTGSSTSKHFVTDLQLYQQSYTKGFEHFYGPITDCCILALLPSYLEREGSSLVYMVDDLIKKSGHPESGFYLGDLDRLASTLKKLDARGTSVLLIGVSFALLDLVEKHRFDLQHTVVMETGGMKGRRKEMIRKELHLLLGEGFGLDTIHSEYGMTELLSQAYSKGNGVFNTPPWMRVMVRDTEDPLTNQTSGKTGGINIIDLANANSCSFIATQDLGKVLKDGSFEISGRFDHSDIRGCNLMVL
ncbi:acyl transferase [Flavobacteriaceae bacterium TP-CH-4]|uniref:Acyl transferase n=1 Tax=Pelagihabitans pacificus TaxID=2696054 RepID=A0A967E5J9_9FLAO|nr:acyl transferase [Pelagihabitans pacificus]NHF58665.1 acyl transferase [Pelagihabitans pacificus]